MPDQRATQHIQKEVLLQAGLKIAADSCSLIFLNKLHLLEIYAETQSLALTQALYKEITHRPDTNNTKEDKELYIKLFSKTVLPAPGPATSCRELPSALSSADFSLIYIYETHKLDGILTDDKSICRYCKKYAIPYINTPMALFTLLYNGKLSRNQYTDTLGALYDMGRYGKSVREHMEKLYAGYCNFTNKAE